MVVVGGVGELGLTLCCDRVGIVTMNTGWGRVGTSSRFVDGMRNKVTKMNSQSEFKPFPVPSKK